jgi:hypothetical protein
VLTALCISTVLGVGVLFGWRTRRRAARFVHAASAERAFLYYLSARMTPLTLVSTLLMCLLLIGATYQLPALLLAAAGASALVLVAGLTVHYRAGVVLGTLLSGGCAQQHDAERTGLSLIAIVLALLVAMMIASYLAGYVFARYFMATT